MRTILVAENDALVRRMVTQILRDAGYRVLASGSGDDAVMLAKRQRDPIDLLIADIVMPGMGGADLYAWLRSEQPDLPVLFISGFMSREPLPGAFLKKPFTPAALLEKVHGLLGLASGA